MVEKVGIANDSQTKRDYIGFRTVHDRRNYKIFFARNWHPGKTIEDYRDMMITTKTFDQLTAGMSKQDIQGIKRGVVSNGMTKNAVLVTYGYPPEHRTRSIYENTWIYWASRHKTFKVCFDENELVKSCR
jgi:hypothetical protein